LAGLALGQSKHLPEAEFGKLTLIDFDHMAESNINRQIHALDDTLGMSKILAMQQRIAHINPQCAVECIDEFVTPENWPAILPSQVDAVIDACDQIKAKTAMAAWAMHAKTIFITVGAAGGKRASA
jgi:tRNA A37 threonylcarbamoyladenosine dehydratase